MQLGQRQIPKSPTLHVKLLHNFPMKQVLAKLLKKKKKKEKVPSYEREYSLVCDCTL